MSNTLVSCESEFFSTQYGSEAGVCCHPLHHSRSDYHHADDEFVILFFVALTTSGVWSIQTDHIPCTKLCNLSAKCWCSSYWWIIKYCCFGSWFLFTEGEFVFFPAKILLVLYNTGYWILFLIKKHLLYAYVDDKKIKWVSLLIATMHEALSLSLSLFLSHSLSLFLILCLSVSFSVSVSLSLCLSVCLPLSLLFASLSIYR